MWGRDDFFSLPLLLFLPCSPSPPGCISCPGADISETAWVQFLQRLTSAQRLSKSNPLWLTQQPGTHVPLPAGPLTAAVTSHNILPSVVTHMPGSGDPRANLPWYTERYVSLICVCNHTTEVGLPLSPSCFFCGFFLTIYWNSGARTYPCSCCE